MNSADAEDAFLVHASAEFLACFARFVVDCEVFDEAEPGDEALLRTQETRPWAHSAAHRQWRQALKQLGQLVAHTKAGAYGKMRVLLCCFEHGLAADEDVMVLVQSVVLDLDQVLHDDPDCACQLLSAGSSADHRTR